MFFKGKMIFYCPRQLLFILIGSIIFMSCQGHYFKTEDQPPAKKSPDVHLECIESATETMKAFFKAEMPMDSKISSSWDCYSMALGSFSRYFVGQKNVNEFTVDEFRDLLNNYFRENKSKVNSELVAEIFKVKQLLLGGTRDAITRGELINLREVFNKLKNGMVKLNPHMPVVLGKYNGDGAVSTSVQFIFSQWDSFKGVAENPYSAEARFSRAREAFYEAALDFAKFLSTGQQDYLFSDFTSLFREINLFVNKDKPDLHKFEKYFPSLKCLKWTFLGGLKEGISPQEWSVLLPRLADFYTQFVWFRDFIQSDKYSAEEKVNHWLAEVDMGAQALHQLLASRSNGPWISRKDLVVLIQTLGFQFNILPPQVTMQSLDQVLDVLLNNVLNNPEVRLGKGLLQKNLFDGKSVDELVSLISIWLESERMAIKYFDEAQTFALFGKRDQGGELRLSATVIIQKLTELISHSDSLSEYQKTYFSEFIRVLTSPIDMVVDSQGRIVISTQRIYEYDEMSFRKRNRDYIIAHIIQNSVSNSMEAIKSYMGFKEAEGEIIYQKLFPFLIEMGWMTSQDNEFLKKRFKEANLFGPRSDGNDMVSFLEIADISAMLFSGIKMGTSMGNFIKQHCLFNKGYDENLEVIDHDCVLEVYRSKLKNIFLGLPELISYGTQVPSGDLQKYLDGLLNAANVENMLLVKKIHLRDVGLIPHIIQYIEMIFSRFDLDRNGIIDNREARNAFPNFRQLLRKIPELDSSIGPGKLFSEDDVLPIFLYLMSEQKIPAGFTEKGYFYYWVKFKSIDSMTFSNSRTQISTIMGIIAKELKRGK